MASGRTRLSERKVLTVLLNQGAVIPCAICRLAFKAQDIQFVERDHERCKHTIADEDLDEEWNKLERQRYVHGRNDPRHDCHGDKTADDRRIRDKVRRIRGETKAGPKAKIANRGFPTPEEKRAIKERYANAERRT